jgi:hypothetical protein
LYWCWGRRALLLLDDVLALFQDDLDLPTADFTLFLDSAQLWHDDIFYGRFGNDLQMVFVGKLGNAGLVG